MKIRLIHQIPGGLQYQLDRIEIEADTEAEAKLAEISINEWVDDRIKALKDAGVLERFRVGGMAPSASAPGAASAHWDEDKMGFPIQAYHDTVEALMATIGLHPSAQAQLEENLVKAASAYKKKDNSGWSHTNAKSLPAMAQSTVEKGWNIRSASIAWSNIQKYQKALEADGQLVLSVPTFHKGIGTKFERVLYKAAMREPGDDSGHEGPDIGDDPF